LRNWAKWFFARQIRLKTLAVHIYDKEHL